MGGVGGAAGLGGGPGLLDHKFVIRLFGKDFGLFGLRGLGKNFALGHATLDFAGSSVVHMTGGICALAGVWILGPRIVKFRADGKSNAIPGHHITMAIVGCLILAFGWCGSNTGSTLAGGDLWIGVIATNTTLASPAGFFSAMLFMWWKYDKPDLSMAANGLLAGLVAITALCAFVNSVSAVIVGLKDHIV
jgi:ammonium transporter, Amt family